MTSTAIIVEVDGDSASIESSVKGPIWQYTISSSGIIEEQLRFANSTSAQSMQTCDWLRHYVIGIPKQVLADMFLPIGYPHSVGKEYMQYQICDSIQGLCSYLRGVVSTSAVLTAAGVGDAEATAMSAAMTWAMRDGMGMVGGLTFSYMASSHFDAHVKEFRLFADVINDVGLTLDMLAPYFGAQNILYVTSAATICKIMCGISAGATKGSITQHFCRRGNMADLNAKEGTQETLVSLIGMILGVLLAKYLHRLENVDKNFASSVSWTIFNSMTLVHIVVNYVGVKLLHLRTLNAQRSREVFAAMVDISSANCGVASDGWVDNALQTIPSPDLLSESLFESTRQLLFPSAVHLGVRFATLAKCVPLTDLISQLQGSEKYLIGVANKQVLVALKAGASEEDQLKAFVHAHIARRCVKRDFSISDARACVDLLVAKGLSIEFLENIGWDVKDRLYLGFSPYRVKLMDKKKIE